MLYTCLRWSASARAHVHTPLPYLANGWADCVQILCVTRDPLDKCVTHVRGGVHLHVRTCRPLFHISQTAGRIPFKFCVWLGTHWISVLHMSEVECIRTCARAHLRTMVPPCPLVHRRSRRHTGLYYCHLSIPRVNRYRYRYFSCGLLLIVHLSIRQSNETARAKIHWHC